MHRVHIKPPIIQSHERPAVTVCDPNDSLHSRAHMELHLPAPWHHPNVQAHTVHSLLASRMVLSKPDALTAISAGIETTFTDAIKKPRGWPVSEEDKVALIQAAKTIAAGMVCAVQPVVAS